MAALNLTLHPEEAQAVSRALRATLSGEDLANLLYPTGAEQRAAKRALRKLQWAMQSQEEKAE